MIKITIMPGDIRLSVKLIADLSDYCLASRKLIQVAPEVDSSERALDEKNFVKERTALQSITSGFDGAMHWENVKEILCAQCDKMNPIEAQLAAALNDGSGIKGQPHAVQSFSDNFLELLKNSIDALVRRYLTGASLVSTLEMNVMLRIIDETISVIITDNAGGFSNEYLESFTAWVKDGRYQQESQKSEKKQDAKFYVGGAGLGLRQLCCIVLDGDVCDKSGVKWKKYSVPSGTTSIDIRNNQLMGGAEVVIRSLLSPCLRLDLKVSKENIIAARAEQGFMRPSKVRKKDAVPDESESDEPVDEKYSSLTVETGSSARRDGDVQIYSRKRPWG